MCPIRFFALYVVFFKIIIFIILIIEVNLGSSELIEKGKNWFFADYSNLVDWFVIVIFSSTWWRSVLSDSRPREAKAIKRHVANFI